MPDTSRTVARPQAGLDRSEAMGGFGADVRASFRMPEAPVLEARDLRFGPLAVMELRYDAANYGASAPMPPQDAMLLSLQLRESARHEIVEAGKRLPIRPLARGMACLYDLRGGLTAESIEPFHSVNFLMPLDAPEQPGLPPLSAAMFDNEERRGFDDPVIRALGAALGPSLARPDEAVRLFVDHVLIALRVHLAQRATGLAARPWLRGGLAPWQERRAREFIDAHLTDNLSTAEIAAECDLSVSQFARAFRHTTGLPPHRFLVERRVESACGLLRHTDLPLADIATSCGFADQSHLTKVFQRVMRKSPGAFRVAVRARRRQRP